MMWSALNTKANKNIIILSDTIWLGFKNKQTLGSHPLSSCETWEGFSLIHKDYF